MMLKEKDFIFFDEKEKFLKILKSKLPSKKYKKTIDRLNYNKELLFLQSRLVDLQNYIKSEKMRVCIIFEGRDAAGKGGAIKRFTQHLNPRNSRIVALPEPTIEEKGQWYFRRYMRVMPNPGEIVFFDRSWYNRAVVEPVMGFCTNREYSTFMSQVNEFENMLIDDGVQIIKFWFSITKYEQKRRFKKRMTNPLKSWKFSNVDMESQNRWEIYTKYKNQMFNRSGTNISPWINIKSNNKLTARIESIKYVLSRFEMSKSNILLDKNIISSI